MIHTAQTGRLNSRLPAQNKQQQFNFGSGGFYLARRADQNDWKRLHVSRFITTSIRVYVRVGECVCVLGLPYPPLSALSAE